MGEVPLWRGLKAVLRRPVVQALLLLPLAVGLLYLAFRDSDLRSVWESLLLANWGWVALAMSVGLLSHVVRAARWNLLLETLGEPVSLSETFYAVMVGYFANLLLPRAGEVARCAQVARAQPVAFEGAVGTMIAERLFDVLAFLLLTLLAIAVSLRLFGAFLQERVLGPFFSSLGVRDALVAAAVLLGGLLLALGLLWAVRRDLFGHRFHRWTRRLALGMFDGMRTVLRMPRKGLFLLYTLLLWLCYGLMTYIICLSLPSTSGLGLESALILLVVGSFGMFLPVQGGMGSFHLAITLWLEVEGLSRVEGLAYATLSHGAQTILLILVPAVLFALRLARRAGGHATCKCESNGQNER